MNEMLKKIRDFANTSHGEQQRKYSPQPYIVHPVKVMEICAKYTSNASILAAALLHDVLEDTAVTKHNMLKFLLEVMPSAEAQRTLDLVLELTDVYVKKDYPQWNRRKRKKLEAERIEKISADAQTIKYADILDNCDDIIREDPQFARVFLRECRSILRNMDKGNPDLYQQTTQRVASALEELETQ